MAICPSCHKKIRVKEPIVPNITKEKTLKIHRDEDKMENLENPETKFCIFFGTENQQNSCFLPKMAGKELVEFQY